MPASSRHSRTTSPPTSTFSGATFGHQKLNVVTRVAIQGKAKKSWDGKADGAAIKMYLKIALPLESVHPGATISLFPEENLKILDSQVHPLDNHSVPYNFSSTVCPLLHKAAGALNLPSRSSLSYTALFGSASSSSNPPPLEDKYTGHILVSGYHVSYVLPKEFPPRMSESDIRSRRSSTILQFMAAIDMWVPFLTKPPHSPYLLSIPIPRCLSNHIKLKIFSPTISSTSSSLASLSSAEDEAGTWDLTSEPHVTRNGTNRVSRTKSYTHFADDESSDSSTIGFSEGCGIQGTFPSAEHIRVRWATPMKATGVPQGADGRRRVGIKEVKADMTCVVLSKGKGKGRGRELVPGHGVTMKLEYSATCKGLWFPGVATMLGMDIGLDAGDCDVAWAPNGERKWVVTGGTGFTGFAMESPEKNTSASLQSSMNGLPAYVPPSVPPTTNGGGLQQPRINSGSSTSSSASLLRAPLPAQNVGDYSFESSATNTPLSSIASLATIPSSPERGRKSQGSSDGPHTDTDLEGVSRPPKAPITVHLNMNDLLPPSKKAFTFTISGTVVVTPRTARSLINSRGSPSGHSSSSEGESDTDPIVLPRFRNFSADKESASILLRNDIEDATLEIHSLDDSTMGTQSRRTVLQPGAQVKHGNEGARIAVRTIPPTRSSSVHRGRRDSTFDSTRLTPNRPRTPNGTLPRTPSTSALRQSFMLASVKPKRNGPLMIPSVHATIQPLHSGVTPLPDSYAVHVSLPAPSDADSEWLEFGLAQPSGSESASGSDPAQEVGPPRVEVASASLEGVPVRFETRATVKQEAGLESLGLTFEETSGKEWITWVRVHVGDAGGGNVSVIYLVKNRRGDADADSEKSEDSNWGWRKGKRKAGSEVALNVLLPTFSLPVGSLEVNLEVQPGFEVASLRSNLTHQQSSATGKRFLHYSMDQFFYPRLSVTMKPARPPPVRSPIWSVFQLLAVAIPTMISLFSLANHRVLNTELSRARESIASYSAVLSTLSDSPPDIVTDTITITSIVYSATAVPSSSSSPHNWWLPSDSSAPPDPPLLSTAPEVPVRSPVPPTSTISTLTPITPVFTTSTSSPVSKETFALLIRDLPILWPLRFDFPSIVMPENARSAMAAFVRGLDTAWQIFRKVVNYPLDPP